MSETHMERMLRLSKENASYGGFFFIIQKRGKGKEEWDRKVFEMEAHEWLV